MSRKDWPSEKIFFRLLNNRTYSTYWDNIRALRKRPNKEVYNRAYELAKSEKDKEKNIGIDILAQLGYNPRFNKKTTVELCFELLDNKQSPDVLSSILSAIGHNNEGLNNKQLLKLSEFENHSHSDVRFNLVFSLSGIENDVAVDTLIKLSEDKHPEVRDWAIFSIGSQIEITNEKIINALWKRMNDEDESTRFEAICGLAKRKDERIKTILIEELKNIDTNGSLILESIEEFRDEEFIGLLENQIQINKRTHQINEKWLIDCFEKLETNLQSLSE